ncbi:hypothetical protein IJT93_08910 [bacterium]|nr:hypothetical protein [bacterium]
MFNRKYKYIKCSYKILNEETVGVILFSLAAVQIFFWLSLTRDIKASENVTFVVTRTVERQKSQNVESLANESSDTPLGPKANTAPRQE